METNTNWYSWAALCIGIAGFFAASGSLGLLLGYFPNVIAMFKIESETLMTTVGVGTVAIILSVLLALKPRRFWLPTLVSGAVVAVLALMLFGLRTPLFWISVAGVAMTIVGRRNEAQG